MNYVIDANDDILDTRRSRSTPKFYGIRTADATGVDDLDYDRDHRTSALARAASAFDDADPRAPVSNVRLRRDPFGSSVSLADVDENLAK